MPPRVAVSERECDDMVGKSIAHYKILKKLGEGGMGEVYLAQDTRLNRKVALKLLPRQYAQDEGIRTRFKREAQAAAALNHPNIVTIHEVSEQGGRPYISMEYIEGPTLKELIAEKEMSTDRVLDLATQMAAGLAAAHAEGILHRDIKPQNVLVDRQGRVRILDFGLAKLKTDSMITETGSTLGTVAYMSPEQAQKMDVDARSDLFSLGIVLYEMVTGRLPFRGDHHAAIMYSIVNENPEPMARFKADVPESLERIVEKALRKDRDTRYQSAADMLADLKELQRDSTSAGISAIGPARPRRRSASAGLVAALLAAAALVVVTFMFVIERFHTDGDDAQAPPPSGEWGASIAVLPFRDFSPNKDQEYFCQGMTDAIINKLAALEDLKTISLSSVMRYKDTDKDIRTIGRELGVTKILEGSIQKEQNRIRLSAQLINVGDDAHLWSHTYDKELESVFAIQDEISRSIVDVLKIRLFGREGNALAKRYTDNVDAYNAYAQGRYLWSKRTEESLKRSIEYFERAIELDPNYALAYAGLSDAWGVLPSNVGYPAGEAAAKAKEAAGKALEIDDGLAEAHASMGLALMVEGKGEEAEPEFLRAIELNPGYAYAHYWYSMSLDLMARREDGMRELEAAYELNPLSVVILTNLMEKKLSSGRSQEAAELFERAVEIEPSRRGTYESYAHTLINCNEPERAIEIFRRAMAVDSSYTQGYAEIAYAYADMEDYDAAIGMAKMAIETSPEDPKSYETLGGVYALSGDLDSAIASFKTALEKDPSPTSSLAKLGMCYVYKCDYDSARSCYDKLIASGVDQLRTMGLGGTWVMELHRGRFEEAIDDVDRHLGGQKSGAISPIEALNGSLVKLIAYMTEERYDDVFRETKRVREILDDLGAQDKMRIRDVEAVVLALKGDVAAADDTLRSIEGDLDLEVPNERSALWRLRGIVELVKGDSRTAITYLNRGLLESSVPVFEGRMFLGMAYLEDGRPAEAAEVLEKALRRYDERRMRFVTWSVLAKYLLARSYEDSGRTDEAITQYRRFLDIWKDVDPGIEEVQEAKRRLAALTAG
jgi:serine/threonine protein kinase/Tfp pilus assembly protein PilF